MNKGKHYKMCISIIITLNQIRFLFSDKTI